MNKIPAVFVVCLTIFLVLLVFGARSNRVESGKVLKAPGSPAETPFPDLTPTIVPALSPTPMPLANQDVS